MLSNNIVLQPAVYCQLLAPLPTLVVRIRSQGSVTLLYRLPVRERCLSSRSSKLPTWRESLGTWVRSTLWSVGSDNSELLWLPVCIPVVPFWDSSVASFILLSHQRRLWVLTLPLSFPYSQNLDLVLPSKYRVTHIISSGSSSNSR